MNIRNLISEIAQEWPDYKALVKVEQAKRAYDLVVNKFPEQLASIAENKDYLLFRGSTGQGNITAAPWIATFDKRITDVATSGYYVVYLFSIDLKRLYLEFGFGTTQFKNHFKKKTERYKKIRTAAKELQERHEKKLLPIFKQALHGYTSREPIDLAATSRDDLHEAYEQSSIYSVEYLISSLPAENQLVNDYNAFLNLYREIVLDSSSPSMEELFENEADPFKTKGRSPITVFIPLPAKKKKRGSSSASSKRRYSKESLKVGDAGETAVLKYEKDKLGEAGLNHLVEQVVHESAVGNTPGWDITSFDENGEKIFIEVRSTTGKTITSVDITDNEWKEASNPTYRENYYLYLVTEALATTSPPIQVLKNPREYVDKDKLGIRPVVHELSFHLKKNGKNRTLSEIQDAFIKNLEKDVGRLEVKIEELEKSKEESTKRFNSQK